MALRVYHCDDSQAFRVLVAELLRDEADMELVGQAADRGEVLAGVAQARPDVVLLDLRGADLGPELVGEVRGAVPRAAIVVLSGWAGPIDEESVAARLEKGVVAAELADTLRAVVRGRRMVDGGGSPGP
jgi:DNA-binding NarL/FixJ family response regulator